MGRAVTRLVKLSPVARGWVAVWPRPAAFDFEETYGGHGRRALTRAGYREGIPALLAVQPHEGPIDCFGRQLVSNAA